jgi:hypothetical protein
MPERKTIKLPADKFDDLNAERQELGMTWEQYFDYLRDEFPND